jgi:hypothetical protein
MSEIFLPLQPRPLEDPAAAGVVQANLEYLMQLFEKGIHDGDTLIWDSTLGRFTAKPGGGVTQVTGLPATPFPGQEILLTDSVINPTYFWQLRYNDQSQSAYKWEYIGGSPAYEQTPDFQWVQSETFVDGDNLGPRITLPASVGGSFYVEVGCVVGGSSNAATGLMSYQVGTTPAEDDDACRGGTFAVSKLSIMNRRRKSNLLPGVQIAAKYRCVPAEVGQSSSFETRWLAVTPFRVG